MDGGGSDWKALSRAICTPSFRRRSTTFARSCCGPGVGKANSSARRPTGPRSWWRAGGRCGETSRSSPLPSWKRTTTSPSASGGSRKFERLNQELAKRTAELEAINKELEAFAYSVSHDLRAPLRHMAGLHGALAKECGFAVLNEKSQRYMTMILESAKRMGNLIDDLLAFSRIGRAETHKATGQPGAAGARSSDRSPAGDRRTQYCLEDRRDCRPGMETAPCCGLRSSI